MPLAAFKDVGNHTLALKLADGPVYGRAIHPRHVLEFGKTYVTLAGIVIADEHQSKIDPQTLRAANLRGFRGYNAIS